MKDKFIQHSLLLSGLVTFQILLWQGVNSWQTVTLGLLVILSWWCIAHRNKAVFIKTLIVFPILSIVSILIFETIWSKIVASLILSIMVGYAQRRIWRFLCIALWLLGKNIVETLKFNLKI